MKSAKCKKNSLHASGLHSLLDHPRIYDAFQKIMCMGRDDDRGNFAEHIVNAHNGDFVLDIGCGTAQILNYLPNGIQYWGYDTSRSYIDAARRRFGDRGHFNCKELTQADLATLPKFDIVVLSGLLHHLDDVHAKSLLMTAKRAMQPKGRLVAIDACYTLNQNIVARFIIRHDRGRYVRTEQEYKRLAESVFENVQGNIRHTSWIPYTHWIMVCKI